MQEQLEERCDIEIEDIDLQRDYDNKENVQRIVSQIKTSDPTLGLVMIIDEISDFLKQKAQAGMTYDRCGPTPVKSSRPWQSYRNGGAEIDAGAFLLSTSAPCCIMGCYRHQLG